MEIHPRRPTQPGFVRSCVRFKRLDDLDEGELRDLLAAAGRLPAPGGV